MALKSEIPAFRRERFSFISVFLRAMAKGRKFRVWWLWLLLAFFILFIKLLTSYPGAIENNYSTGIYPYIGGFFRTLTGWFPFSIGDLLYIAAAIWLFVKLAKYIRLAVSKKLDKKAAWSAAINLVLISALIYIFFNLNWGLNYNRRGISYQLRFDKKPYSTNELAELDSLLVQRINLTKRAWIRSGAVYPDNAEMFRKTKEAYANLQKSYAWLDYSRVSLKPSMFGWLGNYIGFTGYYNPFSGEAQVNTTVPKFLRPYVCCHEVAHQLGYAKENEANFVGWLAASSSNDSLFHYSTYFDLFLYANRNLYSVDSALARHYRSQLDTAAKQDLVELRKFLIEHENPVEPLIRWMYGKYLEANQQPSGELTYDEVIGDVIAYYKKYGKL